MAHSDSLRINIDLADMHRITARILDASKSFQNKNFPIHERVCVNPPAYYLDWFDRYYPNVTLNLDEGTFLLQCLNYIHALKGKCTFIYNEGKIGVISIKTVYIIGWWIDTDSFMNGKICILK